MTQITNTKVKVIPTDAQINITVSGGFYARLSQLITHWGAQKSLEEFTATLERLKTDKSKDEYEYHLVTLLSLGMEIEEAAKAQNKVVEQDIKDLETPKR